MTENESIDEIGLVRLPGIKNLFKINAAKNAIFVSERGLINTKMMDPVIRQKQYDGIKKQYSIIDKAWPKYELSTRTEFEQIERKFAGSCI